METYAVLQGSLEPPTSEQLTKAFEAVPGLSRIDAANMARDAFGIIAGKLSESAARDLCRALNAVGVAADAAPERDIWPLPPRRQTRRLDCLPDHLVIYDPLGRPQFVPWPTVRLLAAGFVKIEIRSTKRVVDHTRMHQHHEDYSAPPPTRTEHVVETRAELLLEVHIDGDPPRSLLQGSSADFRYLGAERQPDDRDNFVHVVRDACRWAVDAVLGRGAEALWADPNRTTFYPSRHAFEEEIAWLRYRNGLSPA